MASPTLDRLLSLSPDKLALYTLNLQQKLDRAEGARHAPIAVVGAAGRFPGGADGVEGLWSLLDSGRDPIAPIPPERWSLDAYYADPPGMPGRMTVREGGFLDAIDRFDAAFFGISPREAASMDPQQRLVLEATWRALEDAAVAPDGLTNSATGVYVGVGAQDYSRLVAGPGGDLTLMDGHFGSGNGNSVIPGRLSFLLGLRGPSVAIDTACSSSLVALHLACQSLRLGECDMALTGGVNVILSPAGHVALSQTGMLAPDGRCKAFAAEADGFGRSEGVAMVVLKRLDDALADGDRVLAVIRGSAVNQDGRSTSLTAPNGPSQEAVIRAALADGGVDAAEVSLLETHGTGTPLGDPIEAQAAHAVYGRARGAAGPVHLGALKSVLGHMETAAGIGGLIKLIGVFRHGRIPANLHGGRLNPNIDWSRLNVAPAGAAVDWPAVAGGHRFAGLSSFGYSGTNAHVVVEAPEVRGDDARVPSEEPRSLCLSAATVSALRTLSAATAERLDTLDPAGFADLCHTMGRGRALLPARRALVAANGADAAARLREDPDAGDMPDVADGGPVFLFTGQGAQYPGMGRGFMEASAAFRDTVERLDTVAADAPGWDFADRPLVALLTGIGDGLPDITDTRYAQPALYAFEVAMAALWAARGVIPAAVLGHSLGEIAAAAVAGFLSEEDGFRLALARGALMSEQPPGAMAMLRADEAQAAALIERTGGAVELAGVNAPGRVAVAGPTDAVDALVVAAEAEGLAPRRLAVSHAFHSAMMAPVTGRLNALASGLPVGTGKVAMLSNLTGGWVERDGVAAPDYWGRHARAPVRFLDSLRLLREDGLDLMIELGPQPQLIALARETATADGAREPAGIASARHDRPAADTLAGAVAGLFEAGLRIDWTGAARDAGEDRRVVDAPPTPFEPRRHWLPLSTDAPVPGRALLGRALDTPLAARLFETSLAANDPAWLGDHIVGGRVLFPAAGFAALMLDALAAERGEGPFALRDLVIQRALEVEAGETRTVQTLLQPADAAGRQPVQVFARRAQGGFEPLAEAVVETGPAAGEVLDVAATRAACPDAVSVDAVRDAQRRLGLDLGPAFAGLSALSQGPDGALGEIAVPAEVDTGAVATIHPVVLDAAFQVLGAAHAGRESGGPMVPVAIEALFFWRPPAGVCLCRARWREGDGASPVADLELYAEDGTPLLSVAGLRFRPLAAEDGDARAAERLFRLRWQEVLPPLPGGHRPDPDILPARLQLLLDAAREDPRLAGYAAFLDEVERIAALAAARAVAAGGAVAADRRELAARVAEIAMQAPDGEADIDAALDALLTRHPGQAAEVALLRRCLAGLPEVLAGSDPVALLFPDGGAGDAEAVYSGGPLAERVNALAGAALAALLENRPGDRPLRVLEVGAGTGSLTRAALANLPESGVEYWYTDVSPHFLEHGRARFGSREAMVFRLFNAELPPGEQDVPDGQFDIVLASNVLHATRDLADTMGHVRDLLRPGGLLLVLEATGKRFGADLTFGLTEGWWRFADRDRRPDHPLLSRAGWLALLSETGFAQARLVPESDGILAEHALIAATRPAGAAALAHDLPWTVLSDRGGVGDALAAALTDAGGTVSCVASGAIIPAFEGGTVIDLRPLDLDRVSGDAMAGCAAATASLVAMLEDGSAPAPRRLLLVTRGAEAPNGEAGSSDEGTIAQAGMAGLLRVLVREHAHLNAGLLDLDPAADDAAEAAAAILDELALPPGGPELAHRNGQRLVPSLAGDGAAPAVTAGGPVRVDFARRGTLDGVVLVPHERRSTEPGEVEIAVHAVGMNFRDVLNLLDLYPGELGPPGEECAGVVTGVGEGVDGFAPGDRVVAIAAGSMATHATVAAEFVRALPEGLSLAEAATVPVAYLTAVVALRHLGRVAAGERVLIHAGAGGVGMAAIHLARAAGAEVFATAHPSKWDTLRGIGVRGIASSRRPGFAAAVRDWSDGAGVDVVLNCLAEPFITESFDVLKRGGRFLEIGRRGIWTGEEAQARRPDAEYHAIVVADEIARDREGVRRVYDAVLDEIASGALPPLPHSRIPASEAAEAFARMSRGGHVGRMVLDFASLHGPGVRADGTYLVTGGLRGLGPHVGRWLAEHGAGRVVLVSRREPDGGAQAVIADIAGTGTAVEVATLDVTDRAALEALAGRIDADGPPLRGIVHGAGVLEDAPLIRQTADSFATVLGPKIDAAWTLHEISLSRPVEMFVLFSAGAALFGSPGQANHAAANAALDRLALWRQAQGLPAVSVDWGPWAEAGAVADAEMRRRIAGQGMGALSVAEGLAALGHALALDHAVTAVLPFDWPVFTARFTEGEVPHLVRELWLRHRASAAPARAPGRSMPAPAATDAAPSAASGERPADSEALARLIREETARVLDLGRDVAIAANRPLRDLGLDSLTSVDLRGRLVRRLDLPLPATLLFDHPTIDALLAHIGPQIWTDGPAPAKAAVASASSPSTAQDGAVAIVGIGCRFPGGVQDRASFWSFLMDGRDGVVEVPPDRWDVDAWYDPDPDAPGRTYSRHGGFLDQVDRFDPAFFNISPREAASMDPQQRLLLETSWEALEDAGLPAGRLDGSATGVYVGICGSDYMQLMMAGSDALASDPYLATGNASSVAAGRIAYALGLQGPAVAVDTACSSSLVAVHMARRSLLSGECDLALAGGVNVMLEPGVAVNFAKAGMLARDGHCKAFDDAADGFVRGEGCAMVALKRLDDALRDGDPVLAVIRGSAMNQDGRSAGLTAPNGPAQEAVIRRALADAGIAPAEIDVAEAHGSGTSLGDPIEAQALGAVLAEGREAGSRVVLGAVKSVLGHLEGAAGIAGLVKAALMVREGRVPGNLHFTTPSRHIDWDRLPLEVAAGPRDWPQTGRPRRAGVSAFGFSGTNVHMVLEQPPAREPSVETEPTGGHLLLLSARTEAALADQLRRHDAALARLTPAALAQACAASQHARTHHEHRLAIAADTGAGVRVALAARLAGARPEGVAEGRVRPGAAPRTAFVFPGQGGQWAGMGRALMAREPVFRSALEEAAAACRAGGGPDVLAALRDAGPLEGVALVQPALFCLQVALARLWRSWGIAPALVIGHSMGEIAAAQVAGALSMEDAARVICGRSSLLAGISGRGGMLAVGLPRQEAQALVAGRPEVAVAVSNSRTATVLSGDGAVLDAIAAELEARNVFARRVKVDIASHGPQVDPLRDDLLAALEPVRPQVPETAFFSTVDGGPVADAVFDAGYWWRNLREPVLFVDALAFAREAGVTHVVEIGSNPVLLQAVEEEGEGALRALGGLPREEPERASLLATLGALWSDGAPVDWTRISDRPTGRAGLPFYPWQRQRHWFAAAPAARRPHAAADPDLDRAVPWEDMSEIVWRTAPVSGRAPDSGAPWTVLGGADEVAERIVAALQAAGCEAGRVGAVADCAGTHAILLPGPADAATAEDLGLCALQALAGTDLHSLHVVTEGAQHVLPGDVPDAAGAALWGFARVLFLERPALAGGVIDLPPAGAAADEAAMASLLATLAAGDGEDQVAIRRGHRMVARLVARPRGAPLPAPAFDAQATYLVTGGLGGIGVAVAEWLAAHGARHLVLTGRRGVAEGTAMARLDALKDAGVAVHAMAADAADAEAMARVVAAVDPAARLKGVFHAAGVTEPARIEDLGPARMDRVVAPKLAGTRVLEVATDGLDLDWFVAFSTGAAIWGSEGQAHYAAASHAMDAVVTARRARGRHGLSVNWGWWQGSGMVDDEAAAYFERMGFHSVPEAACLAALGQLMAEDAAQASVAAIDWPLFRAVQEARRRRPLLEEMAEAAPARDTDGAAGELAARVAALEPSAREAALQDAVTAIAAEVLGFADAGAIDPDTGFFQLGMDSIMAVRLRARLETALGRDFPPSLAFEYPTPRELAAYLAELFAAHAPDAPAEASIEPKADDDDLFARIGALSDDEIDAALFGNDAADD